jgi:hypothetical protein
MDLKKFQIHGTWGGCAIIPTADKYKILKGGKNKNS